MSMARAAAATPQRDKRRILTLDNVGLVHMNGRVYDPVLGRFLSVDPVFQFPTNTQSLNPYSYVLNNPLSLTDPSGYSATDTCATGVTCPAKESANDKLDAMTGSHLNGVNTGASCSGNCANFVVNAMLKTVTSAQNAGVTVTQDMKTGQVGGIAPKVAGNGSTPGVDNANLPGTPQTDLGGPQQKGTVDPVSAAAEAAIGPAPQVAANPSSNPTTLAVNPTADEYNTELTTLSGNSKIPEKTLDALFGAESDRQQFVDGKPYTNPVTKAIGMGQILESTANLYGANYIRLGTDWKYNMETAVTIFKAGYDHPWNADAPNDRFHAIRGYDFYHDGPLPEYHLMRGINGSSYERRYMNYYDQP